MDKQTYFTKALAWSIKSDFEFVRWLVDSKDFKEEAIANKLTRVLYRAAMTTYAKMAPYGNTPSVYDVSIEIEKIAGKEIADRWLLAIESIETPQLGLQREVANSIAEEYDRTRVVARVSDWIDGISNNKGGGSVVKSFSELSDNITSMLLGGESSGRPRDILETARSQRLNIPETTGYSRLDKAIDGGWTQAKFYIWGMPSGNGKTSICCNFASRRCEMGLPTIIHSLEMPARDILFRMICDMAAVSLEVAENPGGNARDESEINRVLHAEKVIDAYVRIYDTPADAPEMRRRIRRHKAEFGTSAILNEIDHIGIVRRNDNRNAGEWSELEKMAYSLVSIAQELNVPLLAFSQVPSEVELELVQNNIVVYNKEFRGSRGIRNAVDVAIMGCRHSGIVQSVNSKESQYDHAYKDHTVIQVTKNRRTGRQFWGVFRYIPENYRLTNERDPGTKGDMYA